MSGSPLSRAAIAAMSVDVYTQRAAEIDRWMRAGAHDGQAAPVLERPTGHVFTRAEIGAMSVDEYEANAQAIEAALRAGEIAPDGQEHSNPVHQACAGN